MGCDIHIYTEVNNSGTWEYDGTWETIENMNGFTYTNTIYNGRNYNLFAILANVRNGYGFAGCDTGDALVPIAPPKGIPDDASQNYKDIVDEWGPDGHSHSHLTVKELMEYNWTQVSTQRGWVTAKEFVRWKLSGKPEAYSGEVSGPNIEHISNEEMEKWIISNQGELSWSVYHGLDGTFPQKKYTKVQWEVPYYECASNFLSEVLPKLWRLGDPDKVRIVFFFDN